MPIFRFLLEPFRRHRSAFIGAVVALIVVDLLDLVPPFLMKLAVDRLLEAPAGTLPFLPEAAAAACRAAMAAPTGRVLLGLALTLVAVTFVQAVGRFLYRRWFIGTSYEVTRDLRRRLFAHLLRLDATFFARTPTGDLMSRATNDLDAVRMFYGVGLLMSIDIVMNVFTVPVLMFGISPTLTLWLLMPLPLLPFALTRLGRWVRRRYESLQQQLADLSAFAQENFAGIRVVKGYAQEAAQVAGFDARNERYLRDQLALARGQSAFEPIMRLGGMMAAFMVLWVGGTQVLDGRMSLGDFVAFNSLMFRLIDPLASLGWTIALYQRGVASLGRVIDILQTVPAIADPASPRLPERSEGRLEICGLAYTPPGAREPALRDVSLRVEPGEMVVILGPVGAGKTTLLHAIPRIIDPPPGTIRLDGVDVREWPLSELRRAVGMVPQDPFLFSESIEENLSLGLEAPAPARVTAALESAGMREEVEAFPAGIGTLLGERGVNLSGGQKQRATLARALAMEPKVLLLDDCFSSVDADREAWILSRLKTVRAGRTTLLVTHRLAALRQADRVVFMEEGRVVEEGTPSALMSAGGPTARYAELQSLREALEGNF